LLVVAHQSFSHSSMHIQYPHRAYPQRPCIPRIDIVFKAARSVPTLLPIPAKARVTQVGLQGAGLDRLRVSRKRLAHIPRTHLRHNKRTRQRRRRAALSRGSTRWTNPPQRRDPQVGDQRSQADQYTSVSLRGSHSHSIHLFRSFAAS
jgi:hypothetical protein